MCPACEARLAGLLVGGGRRSHWMTLHFPSGAWVMVMVLIKAKGTEPPSI